MYGFKSLSGVNEARYKKFCSSKWKIPEPQQLPPTSDELLQHCKHVAYVTGIVKRAIEQNPDVPSPHGYGWKTSSHTLEIEWMTKSPAPESILELISCNCKKRNALHEAVFLSATALDAQIYVLHKLQQGGQQEGKGTEDYIQQIFIILFPKHELLILLSTGFVLIRE